MDFSLKLLRLVGMFPRDIQSRFLPNREGGQKVHFVGRISFSLATFSVICYSVRGLLIIFLLTEILDIYSDRSVFDLIGNILWESCFLLSEMVTVFCILVNNKWLARCCNKIFSLSCLFGVKETESKLSLTQRIGFGLDFVFLFGSASMVFYLTEKSVSHVLLYVYTLFSNFVFLLCCCSVSHSLAVLQAKVHNLPPITSGIHLAFDNSNPVHFSNKIFGEKNAEFLSYFTYNEHKTESHRLLIHLRLQEAVNSLAVDFMDAVGFGILVQVGNDIISITLGTYFAIKTLYSTHVLHNIGFVINSSFFCYKFANMSMDWNREVIYSKKSLYFVYTFSTQIIGNEPLPKNMYSFTFFSSG